MEMQNLFEYEELGRQRRQELLAEAEQRRLAKAARQGRDSDDRQGPQRTRAARSQRRRGLGDWLLTLARNRAM